MKIADQNTTFQNELRKILKKHKLSEKFYKSLCRDILKKPTCPREAPIIRVENSIQFVKRYVINPSKKRSKKQGFRVFYCISETTVYLCMIIDVSEKAKELSTVQYIKIMKERTKDLEK